MHKIDQDLMLRKGEKIHPLILAEDTDIGERRKRQRWYTAIYEDTSVHPPIYHVYSVEAQNKKAALINTYSYIKAIEQDLGSISVIIILSGKVKEATR